MDEIVINDNPGIKFYGSMTSKKKVTFNGEAIEFRYKPANAALTAPFWDTGDGRLAKIAHYE